MYASYKTPYKSGILSLSLKIRYIYCQCYEIILPNGKVIVTDPFISGAVDDFSIDDFTGADYIILNHTHIDHDRDVRQLWDRFKGRIICQSIAAMDVAHFFDIPYSNIYAVDINNKYFLPDFELETFHGLHDNRLAREGLAKRPSETEDFAKEHFGVEGHRTLDQLGSVFMMNYVITTQNNFKISYSAGQDFEEHARHLENVKPNIMLRHRIRTYSAQEYADQCNRVGAQLILPLHHENALKIEQDLNKYFDDVNKVLEDKKSAARAFNPQPYKWYAIELGIQGF